MTNNNSKSVEILKEDVDAIWGAINTLKEKMPYLLALQAKDRRRLVKFGPKSVDFVSDCGKAVAQFPDVVPATFDKAEFERQTAMVDFLNTMLMQLDSLSEKVRDTMSVKGSEAMSGALDAYKYVKTALGKYPGLKSVYEKLGERFKNQGNFGRGKNSNETNAAAE